MSMGKLKRSVMKRESSALLLSLTNRQTDRQTNRQTDRITYRVASQLEKITVDLFLFIIYISLTIVRDLKVYDNSQYIDVHPQ